MRQRFGVNTARRVYIGSRVLQGPQLLLVDVVLLAIALALQVFLSRRKSRWPGLILPGACGVYALGMLLELSPRLPEGIVGVLLVLSVLRPAMIAAALLLAAYALCRWSLRRRKKEEL